MKKIAKTLVNLGKGAFGIIKRFVIGTIDPVSALKSGVKEVIKENLQSEHGGQGNLDIPRLLGLSTVVLVIILFILYISGAITAEQLQQAMDILSDVILTLNGNPTP